MDKSSGLLNTSCAVLMLAKTLPLHDHCYKFDIYFDNYFSNYNLFMELRKLGIGAAGTVSKKAYNFNGHMEEDRGKKPRILPWGTLNGVIMRSTNHPDCEPLKDGVMLYSWRDTGIVFFMSIIYTGNGFILRLRRRLRDTSSGLVEARRPFDFTRSTDNNTNIEANLLDQQKSLAFSVHRVMLPIPLFIDHYNHFMGGVDISDQLRAVYCTQQPSVHNWHPYFFYFLDVAICNSYLLWKWYRESLNDGRATYRLNSHRFYRECLVEALIEDISIHYNIITIQKNHVFIQPNQSNIPAQFHVPTERAPRVQCYFCRYKVHKKIAGIRNIFKTTKRCESCDVPLCTQCFKQYYLQIGTVIGGG